MSCEERLGLLNQTLLVLQDEVNACHIDPCAEVTGNNDADNNNYNLGLHIAAIFIIFLFSTAGMLLPLLGQRLKIALFWLTLGKHFGTGVLISLGLVHMLLPANEALTNECLGSFSEDYEAFAYLFAALTIVAMSTIEHIAKLVKVHHTGDNNRTLADIQTSHAQPDLEIDGSQKPRTTTAFDSEIKVYLLEVGISIHSIIIGIVTGIESEKFDQLLTALVFHQFFEGIGLGTQLVTTSVSFRQRFLLGMIFATSAPIGIAIGIGLRFHLRPESEVDFLLTQGILEAICAGILLYAGFILLLVDFPKDMEEIKTNGYSRFHMFAIVLALWIGVGLMSFIGKYI